MANFWKRDGRYGVQIITGPRSVWLQMVMMSERIDEIEVAAAAIGGLQRNPSAATVRARLLEGTDEANHLYRTAWHPWAADYAVDDYNDECVMLRRAAFAIVERLATQGEQAYGGDS
jgi:hypothetical protein